MNRRPPRTPPHRQRGQALAEFAILAVVLVPLLLLLPMLGKYIHARQMTQQAVRAAAWDATVAANHDIRATMDPARQQRLTLDRQFGHPDDPIRTTLPEPGEPGDHLGNPMLNTFSNQPLLERDDVEVLPYQYAAAPGVANTVLEHLPDWLPGSFPPSDSNGNVNGLVTAEIVVRFQNLRVAGGGEALFLTPFDSLDLQLSASHTLLADTWNARGSGGRGSASAGHHRSVLSNVQSLAFASNLTELHNLLRPIRSLRLIPVIGTLSRLRPGIAEDMMDVVPHDKLEPFTP